MKFNIFGCEGSGNIGKERKCWFLDKKSFESVVGGNIVGFGVDDNFFCKGFVGRGIEVDGVEIVGMV